jgi:hypothetical protein
MDIVDFYACLFMLALIVLVIGISLIREVSIAILILIIIGSIFGAIILFFLMRAANQKVLNKMLEFSSIPLVTFLLTTALSLVSFFLIPSEILKRLIIAGIGLFACWLICLPNFVRREFGKLLHKQLDTKTDAKDWTDIVYTCLGVALFGGALIMQYFFIDSIS